MCYTPYCDGSCEDCERQKIVDEENQESIRECPYRKECNWETLDVKTDICITCGLVTNY